MEKLEFNRDVVMANVLPSENHCRVEIYVFILIEVFCILLGGSKNK